MRSLLVAVVASVALASQASAQCYYIAPPTAPDMRGPGFYFTNPYGVTYGPNHCVRPPFPPYQGVIPGPNVAGLSAYATNPAAYQAGGFGAQGCPVPNFPGFTRHPFARSPRDFFMYDAESMVSPYNYGTCGSGPYRGEGCRD